MTLILNTKYRMHTAMFYKNRFLRIYPIYFFVLLIIFFIGLTAQIIFGRAVNNWNSIFINLNSGVVSFGGAIFVAFANLSMLFQDVIMFLKIKDGGFIFGDFSNSSPPIYTMLYLPQAWSISVEILFYAVAPFIVKSKKLIAIFFAVSFFLRLSLHGFGYKNDPFGHRFFPSELSVFLLGAMSWHIYAAHSSEFIKKRVATIRMLFCAIFVFWPYIFSFNDLDRYFFRVIFALIVPYFYNGYKDNLLDGKIGDLSYPFYLTHLFSIQVFLVVTKRLFGDSDQAKAIAVIVAAMVATGISWALLVFVQNRFEVVRKNNLIEIK